MKKVQAATGNVQCSEPRKKYLSTGEIEALLKATEGHRNGVRDKAVLLLAYAHAFRVSELCALTLADIDLAEGTIAVKRRKGSLSTNQVLQPEEARAISKWLKRRPQAAYNNLFLSERGLPLNRRSVWVLVGKYARLAGFTFKVSPHDLRHSRATHLASKIDMRLLQDFGGWKNLNHVKAYTQVHSERFREVPLDIKV